MFVVIMGAWTRSEAADYELVNKLLTELSQQYPSLFVVTSGCDRGIGKIVKNRCMPKDRTKRPEIDFCEIGYHIWADRPTSARMSQLWNARNAALFESGEEFHLFMDSGDSAGTQMQDLLRRVQDAGRPYSVYTVHDKKPKLIRFGK